MPTTACMTLPTVILRFSSFEISTSSSISPSGMPTAGLTSILDHGFHDTEQGTRFTLGLEARTEALDRLLQLNFERFVQEVEDGFHEETRAQIVTDAEGTIRLETS